MPQPLTVLFVDDDPAILRMIRRALLGRPFEVVTVSTGAEAIEVMESRRIDVLVSDLEMPQMSGIELMQLARRRFPGTLRMVLTGAASPETTLDAINRCEVVRFFPKVFEPELFAMALHDLEGRIEQSRGDDEIAAREARRERLLRQSETRFPGVMTVGRDGAGRMIIDLPARVAAARAAGSAAAGMLLPRGADAAK
jgi:response regulator RpfG family c-di-GMP phosphodiesterase